MDGRGHGPLTLREMVAAVDRLMVNLADFNVLHFGHQVLRKGIEQVLGKLFVVLTAPFAMTFG